MWAYCPRRDRVTLLSSGRLGWSFQWLIIVLKTRFCKGRMSNPILDQLHQLTYQEPIHTQNCWEEMPAFWIQGSQGHSGVQERGQCWVSRGESLALDGSGPTTRMWFPGRKLPSNVSWDSLEWLRPGREPALLGDCE